MKKIISIIVILIASYYGYEQSSSGRQQIPHVERSNQVLEEAIRSRQVDFQVRGSGTVLRVLADDTTGSRHQRFILRLDSGHTLLVAHNIDLAPRVADLQIGQPLSFFGEYEWNERGGVIHWTHDDPNGRHVAGWLEYDGKRYK